MQKIGNNAYFHHLSITWGAQRKLMSSSSPEIPIESGSYADMKVWDVNAVAEPIMRIWQLSEALSRMSRRIQKRYPREARILKTASEDVIYSFYRDIEEKQEDYLKNSKSSEVSSAKDSGCCTLSARD